MDEPRRVLSLLRVSGNAQIDKTGLPRQTASIAQICKDEKLIVAKGDEYRFEGLSETERPCLFASGEASGSERLCLPPQVRPQSVHAVRQNIAWHPEVNGDLAVVPAVYYLALQQPAVVRGQVPEEGAKSIRCGMHSGDLGRHAVATRPGWFPRYFSCPPVASAPPKYLGPAPSPSEGPGNTKTGHLLGHGAGQAESRIRRADFQ